MAKCAEDYQVGWICALPQELAAAKGILDDIHAPLMLPANDRNQYSYGHIGPHNVVIACLPAGRLGTASAANLASRLHTSFTNLRFALLVGIGGRVPSPEPTLRLGDVVVSQPSDTFGGAAHYPFGKTEHGGVYRRPGVLNSPPPVLLAAVAGLQAKHLREGHRISHNIQQMFSKYPKMRQTFASPGAAADSLYQANYHRPGGEPTYVNGKSLKRASRETRADEDVRIHYTNIASGDEVTKHSLTRDRISRELRVMCFEMEAAGLLRYYSCLIIRGICDYADTHRNKQWQNYAAACAAAYAKELLGITPPPQVVQTDPVATQAGAQVRQPQKSKPAAKGVPAQATRQQFASTGSELRKQASGGVVKKQLRDAILAFEDAMVAITSRDWRPLSKHIQLLYRNVGAEGPNAKTWEQIIHGLEQDMACVLAFDLVRARVVPGKDVFGGFNSRVLIEKHR